MCCWYYAIRVVLFFLLLVTLVLLMSVHQFTQNSGYLSIVCNEIAICLKRKHLIVFHKASEINSKEMLYSYGVYLQMLVVSDKWKHRLHKMYLFLNVFYKVVNYTCAVGAKVRLIFYLSSSAL